MIPALEARSSTLEFPSAARIRSATTPASSTPLSPPPTTANEGSYVAGFESDRRRFVSASRSAPASRCASSRVESGTAWSLAPGTDSTLETVPAPTTR